MSSHLTIIISIGILCLTTNIFTKPNYFNQKIWFNHGNIFHIKQRDFFSIFQQHRNVNRHINWLTNEINFLNSQIKFFTNKIIFINENFEQHINISHEIKKNSSNLLSSINIKLKNEQNIYILKLLLTEPFFHEYLNDLFEIYEYSLLINIECIAIIQQENFQEKTLLIKLSNGLIDQYQMNKTKSFSKYRQTIYIWNTNGKKPEYYRRFVQQDNKNQITITDQLTEIKNRPRLNDVNFFDMMGQILRIKYHTDPSSLSCILEIFFGNIYTCDGRLIYPHELKLLSDNNNFFVFYAIMIDTNTERQIYPLDKNNHIRFNDQIFFLFNTHPQFNTLSSLTCPDCSQRDQTYILDKKEQDTDNQIIESKPSIDNFVENSFYKIPQNYIVYVIVTSILIYILIGICISRKHEPIEYYESKHSISSRRGR